MSDLDRYVTVGEAATLTGLHPDTIRKYVDDKTIIGTVLPSGHRRVDRADLDRFRAETFPRAPEVETPSPLPLSE